MYIRFSTSKQVKATQSQVNSTFEPLRSPVFRQVNQRLYPSWHHCGYSHRFKSIMKKESNTFQAKLDIIGINPFVFVPQRILEGVFLQAGRDKSPIPVKGTVNGLEYRQTLMKYQGHWRLYINLVMLKNSPKRIGETIEVSVQHDPEKREVALHPKLLEALEQNPEAKEKFESLIPSKRTEIAKYMSWLKTEESIDRNVEKVMATLQKK